MVIMNKKSRENWQEGKMKTRQSNDNDTISPFHALVIEEDEKWIHSQTRMHSTLELQWQVTSNRKLFFSGIMTVTAKLHSIKKLSSDDKGNSAALHTNLGWMEELSRMMVCNNKQILN